MKNRKEFIFEKDIQNGTNKIIFNAKTLSSKEDNIEFEFPEDWCAFISSDRITLIPLNKRGSYKGGYTYNPSDSVSVF